MSNHISSYPKSIHFGGEFSDKFFDTEGPIIYQEKIDGSQISFMTKDGELYVKSKNVEMREGIAPMFDLAISRIESIQPLMKEGYTYRGEYLAKPRHNIVGYGRVPRHNIAIFDVQDSSGVYLHYLRAREEAFSLGFSSIPSEVLNSLDVVDLSLIEVSALGGTPEGIVFKRENNDLMNPYDDKPLIIKLVRDDIKEVNYKKNRGFKREDVLESIINMYKTEPRWGKAIIHLEEQGKLQGTMRDIPYLVREVQRDVFDECGEDIKNILFEFFKQRISSGLVKGLPEFYKSILEDK